MERYLWIIILIIIFLVSIYCIFNLKKENFSEGIVGTSFVSRVPKGAIIAFSPPDGNVANIPAGWVLCDGTNGAPNLNGKFIMGYSKNSCGIPNNVGKDCNTPLNDGGEYTHTLTQDETPLPNHSHNWGIGGDGKGTGPAGVTDGFSGSATAFTVSTTTTGSTSNKSHNNTPPYVVLLYIMKT